MDQDPAVAELKKEKRDANTCMALGAGVGVLGVTSAAVTGALCPLCIIVAPALIGVGAFKRWRSEKKPGDLKAEGDSDGNR